MNLSTLLKQLAREGFSIIRSGNFFRVRRNHMIGTFSILNGRPVQLYTVSNRIASEYNEGYQPGTLHYSTIRFIAALKQD